MLALALVSQESSPGVPSPTTVQKGRLDKSFRVAKLQVNRDLVAFLAEARAARDAGSAEARRHHARSDSSGGPSPSPGSDGGEDSETRQQVLDTAQRCLEEGVVAFKDSIKSIVDDIEVRHR
jgi:hypothetical protein